MPEARGWKYLDSEEKKGKLQAFSSFTIKALAEKNAFHIVGTTTYKKENEKILNLCVCVFVVSWWSRWPPVERPLTRPSCGSWKRRSWRGSRFWDRELLEPSTRSVHVHMCDCICKSLLMCVCVHHLLNGGEVTRAQSFSRLKLPSYEQNNPAWQPKQ